MPLTDAQNAALNRLKSYYEGDNPYNSVTNPGGFRQGGHLYNFVPALKDVAAVIVGCASLAADVVANSAQSPKAVRVDSAQTFTPNERRQGKINLGAGGVVAGSQAAVALIASQMNGMFFLLNGNFTVKLPPVVGLVNGDYVELANVSNAPVTVQAADNDTAQFYRGPGIATASFIITPGGSVTVGFDGTNFLCFSRSLAPERALDVDTAQTFNPTQRGTARSSLKLAASAFVYSSGNRTLTKDDVGTVFYTDSTQTITLPLVSDCVIGDTIEFYVYGGTLTLAQPAGNANAIGIPGGGGQTIALTVGAYVLKRQDVAWRLHNAPNNAVLRSGDTMTGDLVISKAAGFAGVRMTVPGKTDHFWRAIDNGRMQLCDGGQTVEYFSVGTDGSVSTRQFGDLNSRIEQRASDNQNAAVNRSATGIRLAYQGDYDITGNYNGGMVEPYGGGVCTGRSSITSGDGNDIIIRAMRFRQPQIYIQNSGWVGAYYA